MRGTLIAVLAVACLMAMATVASADLVNGGHKQTDFPEVSLYLMVVDPYTDAPLMLPVSPDGKMVEASPKQVPKNAILRVFVLAAGGSRDIRWVKLRIGDGKPAFELKAPYTYDIDTRKTCVGPHLVEVVIMTTEGRWATKSAAYYVDAVDISKYLPQAPMPAAQVTRSDVPPAGQPAPARRLAPASEYTKLYCAADSSKIKPGDVLDLYAGNQLVGRAIVDSLTRNGFVAVLLEGEAPEGADVVIPDQEVK